MNVAAFLGVVCLSLIFVPMNAQAAAYLKYEGIKGESSATRGATGSASIQVQVAATGSARTSNPNKPLIQGMVPTSVGIEHEDIGAIGGENEVKKTDKASPQIMQATSKGTDDKEDGEITQTNQSDMDFLRGNAVSAYAVEVRGWDPKQKQEFLATVKAHTQVQSGQDLENFAKGVLLKDENIEEVSADKGTVTVKYQANGKLLGFIPISFTETVELETKGEAAGSVKVKFPWFAFLVTTDVSAGDLEEELAKGQEKWLHVESWSFPALAEAFNTLTIVLKTKHDTVKNSINNIR
ncbi:hypothetical protein A3A39_01155 [Candidatus Kaiserbacteria bacterium RIFCSPLOWO2_01_FULL_54_13]|uniref:Uncharacterized protein n=1 Tax=Candidatus Kaiserbacteria bacterium RIFCSPLOWO2_01_FULL_54_13 TaxID=1798512 RepID=A0A1F6F288_9BACT|nr:MAG: hypothetical protein A3A39_01155 [Candidatus Kaiserbacteria bacterium RIFCSPLOWO2_01_FULL_54_13]